MSQKWNGIQHFGTRCRTSVVCPSSIFWDSGNGGRTQFKDQDQGCYYHENDPILTCNKVNIKHRSDARELFIVRTTQQRSLPRSKRPKKPHNVSGQKIPRPKRPQLRFVGAMDGAAVALVSPPSTFIETRTFWCVGVFWGESFKDSGKNARCPVWRHCPNFNRGTQKWVPVTGRPMYTVYWNFTSMSLIIN